jgi:hypothetical protein
MVGAQKRVERRRRMTLPPRSKTILGARELGLAMVTTTMMPLLRYKSATKRAHHPRDDSAHSLLP